MSNIDTFKITRNNSSTTYHVIADTTNFVTKSGLAQDTGSSTTNSMSQKAITDALPTTLAELSDDSTHRVVTDTEKSTWDGKSDFSGSYNDLTDKPTIPSEVTETTVTNWGFTKNTGTITGITMNGASKGTSGVVDLGTVITEHQDISGKLDTSKVKKTRSTVQGNVYDVTYINSALGNIETLLSEI
jgi:hypothetical protein